MGTGVLGGFEHQVLLAMLRLGGETYTAAIVLEIERRTDREVAAASVFVALRRLERRGLLTSRTGSAPPGGGRPRRMFQLQPAAIAELRESKRTLAALWSGLEVLERP